MMKSRNRQKQSFSLADRLRSSANQARDEADRTVDLDLRGELLKKAEQAEATIRLEAWLTSPLRPPA